MLPRPAVLNGPGTAYEIRTKLWLVLERPTPRAWTYANNAGEVSREMTLIAEAALRGHIGERRRSSRSFSLDSTMRCSISQFVRRHSQRATEGVREMTH
jgi:hypothetical protein